MGNYVFLKIINWILILVAIVSAISSVIVYDTTSLLSIPLMILIIIQSFWCLNLIKKLKS